MALLTVEDIVNSACALIGEEPPQSLTDDLGGGQSASLLYEATVDFNLGVLASGFTFAREMRQLSRRTEPSAFTGYLYVFDIPGPFTGLPVFLTDDPSDPRRRYQDYLLTNNQVHASDDPLYAMVKFRPDPHRWTGTFKMMTITALAAKLAMAIASDRTTMDTLDQKAYGSSIENFRGGMMRAALSEDGFANPPRPADMSRNPLERARMS